MFLCVTLDLLWVERHHEIADVIFELKRHAAGIPFDGGGNGVATLRQSRELECAIATEESRLRVKGAIGADGDAHTCGHWFAVAEHHSSGGE